MAVKLLFNFLDLVLFILFNIMDTKISKHKLNSLRKSLYLDIYELNLINKPM